MYYRKCSACNATVWLYSRDLVQTFVGETQIKDECCTDDREEGPYYQGSDLDEIRRRDLEDDDEEESKQEVKIKIETMEPDSGEHVGDSSSLQSPPKEKYPGQFSCKFGCKLCPGFQPTKNWHKLR